MPTGGYVICEYEKVRDSFPEFQSVLNKLRTTLIARAEKDWPLTWVGRRKIGEAAALGVTLSSPGPGLDVDAGLGEFGETTIIPSLFRGMIAAYQPLVTWEQWLNATGAQTIMSGANGGAMYQDYKVGIAGFVFLDKAIRISEIKMQISDKKLPRINIEEALVYNKPAVVFEEGYIIDEQTMFDLYAYVTTPGPQRIKLLGLQVYRVKDKLLSNCGSPLV
ncbi:hypothetical protein ES702_03866 [subsurface metagenome]